jgi:nitroimidazol reductase NimA-like FMN-containing flavoprotein (pyridoxamine 5'-phosphate oxidase superfamily)
MSDTSGADTVDPAATDRRGLKVLGFDECLQRLRDAVVGRVGFLRDGEIAILPVNHVVDGMDIAFRTSWGSKLQTAADAGRVAFEVDGHDRALSTGWSVLVHGTATLVYEAEDRERLDAIADKPWIPLDVNTFWVRIRPEEITGREVLPPPAAP